MHDTATTSEGDIVKCPFMNAEQQRVKDGHRALASTGCSRDVCQSGRAVHTDEPRVGENRSLESVCQEAEAFLRDLSDEGFFADEVAFEARLHAVHTEIRNGTKDGVAREDKIFKRLGGNWTQSYEELEFGIRRSWLNSRKCIARNHHQELKLCDLRSVTTSAGMAESLLQNAIEAFHEGRVEPTVFVFPPRQIDERGPMIWNNQLLGFAGYQMDDGGVLGDPANIELTRAIIEFGWTPPQPRGRWDLLPLAVMAEGDKPVMMEIPAPLSKRIHIRHPEYSAIGELDLRWVVAPALTRLGFDIGGVQYTAAPFIGWFMDAEIGVRNLADSFRYNVLPNVVKAMSLTDGKSKDGSEEFADLPEYEQLKMLSRAQSELTYAVQWSYNQEGVTMTDSLTASKKWCKFDDEFKEKNGFRLPADPYWIAPPQGSIVPVWHRGGAPNYQPKPMISRHVQAPTKAWGREKNKWQRGPETTEIMTLRQSVRASQESSNEKLLLRQAELDKPETNQEEFDDHKDEVTALSSSPPSRSPPSRPSLSRSSSTTTLFEQKTIAIYFCSAGTVAEKLAKRLYKRIQSLKDAMDVTVNYQPESLDHLQPEDITPDKILLLIVSSVGKGEVPANGSGFLGIKTQACFKDVSFAVFGNGDSRYSVTYNGAANVIDRHMLNLGGHSLIGKVFRGDTAIDSIPYKAVNSWWNTLRPKLEGLRDGSKVGESPHLDRGALGPGFTAPTTSDNTTERLLEYSNDLSTLKNASIVSAQPSTSPEPAQRSMLLTLDIGSEKYDDMNCVQILPLNHPSKVDRALTALAVDGADKFEITEQQGTTNAAFLSTFADLEQPFKSMDWLSASDEKGGPLMQKMLSRFSVLETLELLKKAEVLSHFKPHKILRSADLLQPKTYSVASTPHPGSIASSSDASNTTLSIMLKRIPDGRFSSTYLDDHLGESGPLVKYRIVDSVVGPSVRPLIPQPTNHADSGPLVLIATGAGFGPIRGIIASRIAAARKEERGDRFGKISVFLGLHPTDVPLAMPVLQEAAELGLTEKVEIVESNDEKRRVQDVLSEKADSLRKTLNEEGRNLFVCTNDQAAGEIKDVVESVVPAAWEEGKKPDWYLEETF